VCEKRAKKGAKLSRIQRKKTCGALYPKIVRGKVRTRRNMTKKGGFEEKGVLVCTTRPEVGEKKFPVRQSVHSALRLRKGGGVIH